MNADLFSNRTQEAIKGYGRHTAGWLCTYTPLEILDAAGLTPVRIAGEHCPIKTADSLMHTNMCPYIKSCLDSFEEGKLDFLDAVVFTSGCDAQRRLYDLVKSRYSQIPSFLISVPKITGHEAERRLASEYVALRGRVEEAFNKKVDDKALWKSIDAYRYLRARARGLDGARRRLQPTMTGSRMLELMLMMQRMPAGEAIKLIDNEEEKIKGKPMERKPNVLLAGNVLGQEILDDARAETGGRPGRDTGLDIPEQTPVSAHGRRSRDSR